MEKHVKAKEYLHLFGTIKISEDELLDSFQFAGFMKGHFDIVNISWHISLKDITDYAASSKSS